MLRHRFVDRWYFKCQADLTDDDRDAEIRERMRVQYEHFLKKASNYQIRRELVVKLQSMKNYMVSLGCMPQPA